MGPSEIDALPMTTQKENEKIHSRPDTTNTDAIGENDPIYSEADDEDMYGVAGKGIETAGFVPSPPRRNGQSTHS